MFLSRVLLKLQLCGPGQSIPAELSSHSHSRIQETYWRCLATAHHQDGARVFVRLSQPHRWPGMLEPSNRSLQGGFLVIPPSLHESKNQPSPEHDKVYFEP
ncbi:hypothetical protein BDM02DRAFT_2316097 [Thelephora ganbajun]|uniref:Uncharacterized protein n=1 Tax=Thelephora ganbajun TaxID=370292 RepID=A0ACB6ZFB9_THEGA|nr:hypothetical protein BDM02DRAFT_2316097 [Thelephora ganbajun]